jgi:MYND finger
MFRVFISHEEIFTSFLKRWWARYNFRVSQRSFRLPRGQILQVFYVLNVRFSKYFLTERFFDGYHQVIGSHKTSKGLIYGTHTFVHTLTDPHPQPPLIYPVQMSAIALGQAMPCSHCGKATTRVCDGCKGSPDIQACYYCEYWEDGLDNKETFYCSTECQRCDWPTHRIRCKLLQSRKYIHRAASTLQEIFYVHREKVFDTEVDKIEEKDGKLYVHEKKWKPKKIKNPYELIFPLPSSIFQKPEDKMAVLANNACTDAVAWMHDLVDYFLSGE